MKNQEEFQKMNCKGCACNECDNAACIDCLRCYRAEYAEENWNDYYRENCLDSI